jgi:YidC/Oxa1 family membrane protein insertase
LLTLLIKILTWPITDKAYSSAERMKKIQPKLQELKEKYANDQQRMTEETMKVFKENNVSPLGCLPMLIQIPILYALFVMIYNSVELYRANFALWYTDLSAPDPYFVLPILMGAVMVVQQRMTTIETPNPQMAMMMKIMPIMFTAFMLFLPAGLVLYYFVNLILGLAQQFWIKRKFRLAEEAQGA